MKSPQQHQQHYFYYGCALCRVARDRDADSVSISLATQSHATQWKQAFRLRSLDQQPRGDDTGNQDDHVYDHRCTD